MATGNSCGSQAESSTRGGIVEQRAPDRAAAATASPRARRAAQPRRRTCRPRTAPRRRCRTRSARVCRPRSGCRRSRRRIATRPLSSAYSTGQPADDPEQRRVRGQRAGGSARSGGAKPNVIERRMPSDRLPTVYSLLLARREQEVHPPGRHRRRTTPTRAALGTANTRRARRSRSARSRHSRRRGESSIRAFVSDVPIGNVHDPRAVGTAEDAQVAADADRDQLAVRRQRRRLLRSGRGVLGGAHRRERVSSGPASTRAAGRSPLPPNATTLPSPEIDSGPPSPSIVTDDHPAVGEPDPLERAARAHEHAGAVGHERERQRVCNPGAGSGSAVAEPERVHGRAARRRRAPPAPDPSVGDTRNAGYARARPDATGTSAIAW